ncbi:hypothetical protein [Undibacterium sp.]|uniref:hypothetical protein n=1 Tax=Undibacterium sp. TaxID=1914977 RepID=UPI0025D02982|nr:hypothetical protein [Undibacterium sp.]
MNRNNRKYFSIIFCVLLTLILVTACREQESVPSLDRNGLMTLVFKDWSVVKGNSIVLSKDLKLDLKERNTPSMDLQPLQVVRLSDTRAVLLVAAQPVVVGHSSQAALGAYWFKLEGDQWSLENRQDEVAWLGSFGHFGSTKVLDLSSGKFGLIVESNYSGMGQEITFADLFFIGDHKITPMLNNQNALLFSTVIQLGTSCDKWIDQAPGTIRRFRLSDNDFSPQDCFKLNTKFQVKKGNTVPGNLILNSEAKMVVHRVIKQDSDGNNSFTSFEQKTSAIQGTEEYRFDPKKERYAIVSGHSVVPEWARQY